MRVKENVLGVPISLLFNNRSPLRIAITGTQASGKTVFLTSLLAHLKYHDPGLLHLGDNVEIIRCETLSGDQGDLKEFPYEAFRSKLLNSNEWPDKTADSSSVKLEIEIKLGKKKTKRFRLEFLDFSGERTADFHMFSLGYSEWSDSVWKSIEADPCYMVLAKEYSQALEEKANERDLVNAYKRFLGQAFSQQYSRLITPSVFLLDAKGKRPSAKGTPESWAEDRYCGLEPDKQFVPLPSTTRQTRKDLVKTFESRYHEYKMELVTPLVQWIQEADQLYLFIDILEILMSSSSRYNDEQGIAERTLNLCDGRGRFWRDLAKVGIVGSLFCWPSRVQRVGVVATKTDLVAADDVDNMESLLKEMTRKTLRGIDAKNKEFFTCSAVKSTERCKDERKLKGRLVCGLDGKRLSQEVSPLVEYPVSVVPESWPKDDEWSNFCFPEVYPKISKRRDAPPDQEGLGKILKFMLNLEKCHEL